MHFIRGAVLASACALVVGACSSSSETCAESKTCTTSPDSPDGRTDGASGAGGKLGAGGATAGSSSGGAPGAGHAGQTTSNDGSAEGSTVSCTPAQLQSDPNHCGECTTSCASTGTKSRACTKGVCVPTCDADHRDCNGTASNPGNRDAGLGDASTDASDGAQGDAEPSGPRTIVNDGCEIDITMDAKHCGGCNMPCAPVGTTANVCVNGECKATCDANHVDDDGNARNGCEIDLRSDPDNCGTLGYKCSSTGASERKCIAGKCAPICTTDLADCANTAPSPDDGCETDITTATNCGKCGHGCLGGSCSAHVCKEFAIATGLSQPFSITADDNYVHWVDGRTVPGRLVRATLLGANVTPLQTNQSVPGDVFSDGQSVYWTNSAINAPAIQKIAVGSSIPTDVATQAKYSTLKSPGPIAVDATNIYWGDTVDYSVWKMNKDLKTPPESLGKIGLPVLDIEIDSTFVYYASIGTGLVPIDKSAGPRAIGGDGTALAVDSGFVYYRASSTSQPSIMKIARGTNTGAVPVIRPSSVGDNALAVDATHVFYWASDGLYRVDKMTGANPERLSTNVNNVVKILVHLEGGGEAIYWVNKGDSSGATGSIMKLAL